MNQSKLLEILAKDYSNKRSLDKESLQQTLRELSTQVVGARTVLDLGCGDGRILLPLASLFPSVKFFAFDISEKMINALRQNSVKGQLKNIAPIIGDFNIKDWEDSLGKGKFDRIIMFQIIHFVEKLAEMAFNLIKIIIPGGKVIIATTTHQQFKRLPYCLAFPQILKIELKRTPDLNQILKLFSKVGFQQLKTVDIKIKKRFKNKSQIKKWLLEKPFSAMELISQGSFIKGVDNFLEYYSEEIVVDEFVILTLVWPDHK